jgi:hypothetical protein
VSPDQGLSIFFNSFLKLSLRPLYFAFAASCVNKVNIMFSVSVNHLIGGIFEREFVLEKFHSQSA